ncbi:Poly(A) polymerase beta [Tritrichomonas foetus]|uniref:Poly(A) polymerase n=1 Tax=Tritrichomonas foetus TaxID=1144522 RepID=A0A1J4JPF7_9EUKA|nr:Poly(A) polymerase beta [Tritrichomonas foetus]|eukprot:OHS99156.1 Poly(A) polymerase beta [Tritrichomonas foetus]
MTENDSAATDEIPGGAEEEQPHESTNNPLLPAHEPVNEDLPTELELEATERLVAFLKKHDCYESDERSAKRQEVLDELQGIGNEFVRRAAVQNNIPVEIDGKPIQCLISHFGSFRLGVCSPSSDIDCLCITPKFIKRSNFFSIMYDLLNKNPKVSGLQKIENAFVPILTMTYDTIDIDISFAALDLDTIPSDIDLSDDTILNNLDTQAWSSINGVRTNDMLLQLVPNLESFRDLLRFIRIWSKKRAIYGNVYGYLGGVNCALLAAFICQRYPLATSSKLVQMFFHDLMEWPWPAPIYINTPNVGPIDSWDPETSPDVMPIITPAYPVINSIRSASVSTRHRMVEEFKLGYKLTTIIINKKRKWDKLLAETNFFTRYKYYIQIKISADTQENYDSWQGTVESKIKRLAMDLEKEENIQYAVTFPYTFPTHEGGKEFAGSFFIGMVFKKPSDPNQKLSIDVTTPTQSFLTFLMKQTNKTAPMLVEPSLIKRQDVPLYVFPNGERPPPKKPKANKKAKKAK